MLESQVQGMNASPAFPLAFASAGERVRIVSLTGGRGFQERFMSMGLAIGDVVEIIQCRPNGAVVIGKEGMRYGLGGGMAQKILVTIKEP